MQIDANTQAHTHIHTVKVVTERQILPYIFILSQFNKEDYWWRKMKKEQKEEEKQTSTRKAKAGSK